MDFYNPMQRKPASAVKTTATPSYQPPTGPNKYKVGNLDVEQLGGVHGTGLDFQQAGKVGSIRALADTQSSANPEDYAAMDEMRNYYRNYLADLPGQTADKVSSFDTQSQRGLKNLMTQYANSQAGTGRLGSRQYAGAQGDIYSKAASDYTTGLINARSEAIDQANKVQSGLSGVQNQNMLEREFQAKQGERMSDMIYRLMALDAGQADAGAQRAAESKANTMGLLQTGATIGGLAAFSDARIKERVRTPSSKEVLKPFRRAAGRAYFYKDPAAHGSGERISPMAQDLLDSGFGDAVGQLEDGTLFIDYGLVVGRMFSAISTLTKELDQLRGELRAKRGGK